MRILPVLLFSLVFHQFVQAQNAYEIKANIKPFNKGYLFLAYHFGSKQYLIDSAKLDANGQATFSGAKKLQGGVYMIVFPEKNGWIECMLDQQQKFSVFADTSNIVKGLRFEGSPDNTLFADYQKKSFDIGTQVAALRAKAGGAADDPATKAAQAQMKQLSLDMQLVP